jgi:hypothetical protein
MFARELLATAELGLADAQSSDPRRWTSGLYVAIVFGRSVTFALQNGQSENPAANRSDCQSVRVGSRTAQRCPAGRRV